MPRHLTMAGIGTAAAPAEGSDLRSAAEPAANLSADLPSDATIPLAREGDDTAIALLLTWIRPILVRVGLHAFRDSSHPDELARDVAQDALLRILTSLPQCRAATIPQFGAWALRITRNLITDYRRDPFGLITPRRVSLNAESLGALGAALVDVMTGSPVDVCAVDDAFTPTPEHDDSVLGRLLEDVATIWGDGVAPTPSPRIPLDAADDDRPDDPIVAYAVALAVAAMRSLEPDTARIVTMRVFEGESWSNIGGVLNTAPACAKRRYRRALDWLRIYCARSLQHLPRTIRSQVRAHFRRWELARRLASSERALSRRSTQRRRPRDSSHSQIALCHGPTSSAAPRHVSADISV